MCHCKNVLNQEEEAGSGKRKNGPMWQLWNCENGQQSTVPRLQSPVPSPQTFDFRPLTLDFNFTSYSAEQMVFYRPHSCKQDE